MSTNVWDSLRTFLKILHTPHTARAPADCFAIVFLMNMLVHVDKISLHFQS